MHVLMMILAGCVGGFIGATLIHYTDVYINYRKKCK